MTPSEFISWILKNATRVRAYKKGGDGSGGVCDCIGLVIGAWRLSGNRWAWTHGSNYTARYLVRGLAHGMPLRLGDLVFKAKEPQEKGYDLPDTYRGHHDLRDYYHVGVVTHLEPLEITHCTSVKGGIKRDTERGKWQYSAQFKYIDEEATRMEGILNATVYAENGKPVNLRNGADSRASLIGRLNVGTRVQVITITDKWAYVKSDKGSGCISKDYLRFDGASDTGSAAQDPVDGTQVKTNNAYALERLYAIQYALYAAGDALSEAITALGGALG